MKLHRIVIWCAAACCLSVTASAAEPDDSDPATCLRLAVLLDECLADLARVRPADPLRRAMLQRDLWAAFDFYISRNIEREGDQASRRRRDELCRKLATVIRGLTLSPCEIESFPDNYALAVKSGRFAAEHRNDPAVDYLPPRLFTAADDWQEIDFFQPSNWGDAGRSLTLVQDCRRCHTGGGQIGVQTVVSLVNQGGVDAGAPLGVAHALPAGSPSPRPTRAARFKSRHETYRRLLDTLGE